VLVVVVSLTHGGERFQWWGLSPSREGLVRSGILVLRVLSIVLLVFPAFGTSRFDVTIKALGRLRVPAPLIQIVLFSYRYLFVYSDQMRRMGLAQRARGFRARMDLKTLQLMGNRIGVLLVGSVERTQRIQGAMKCRGFSGTYRTLGRFTTRPVDVLASGVLLTIGVIFLVWRVS
jgi:cobalt/nickel transport system permease protein